MLFRQIDYKIRTEHNEHSFPPFVQRKIVYSFEVRCKKDKLRKYIGEIHEYNGFAMFKYYPRSHKDRPNKYDVRGIKCLGYLLTTESFNLLLLICSEIMKSYILNNENNYIGYVGMVDVKDNSKGRINSQRFEVYNTIVNSIFNSDQYKFITRNSLKEINMRLIRKHINRNHTQTELQRENFQRFFYFLKDNPKELYELMTNKTKESIIKQQSI